MSSNIQLYSSVIAGSAFRVSAVFTDFDQTTLIDPDSQSLTFIDPNGTQHGNAVTTPTRGSTGNWHYDFITPSSGPFGLWTCKWTVIKASLPSIQSLKFSVVAE